MNKFPKVFNGRLVINKLITGNISDGISERLSKGMLQENFEGLLDFVKNPTKIYESISEVVKEFIKLFKKVFMKKNLNE